MSVEPRTCRTRVVLLLASLAVAGCGRESASERRAGSPDSTATTRRRICFLEGARSFGSGELYRDLRHPDPRVRRAAVVALGRIQDAAALDSLLVRLQDPDTTVVVQTAFAIGQLQGVDDTGRHALQAPLVGMVEANAPPTVVTLVEALGKQGGPEIVPVLARFISQGPPVGTHPAVRDPVLEGMTALALARQRSPEARALIAQVGDMGRRDARAAWRIGAAMAADPDTSFFRACVSLLDHRDRFARAQGARALGKMKDRRAVHPLVQHLADLDWEVRASILLALEDLGDRRSPDPEALDFCASLTGDAHPLVREAAVAALDSFGVGKYGTMLRERLGDPVPAVRLSALLALGRAESGRARDAFEAARRDSVEFVRAGALAAAQDVLGDAGALALLRGAARAPSVGERTAAVEALSGLRAAAPEIRSTLERALQDPDFVVAAKAASALGDRGPAASIPALAAAYDAHGSRHEDVDVRLAVMEAVGAVGPRRAGGWEAARALAERGRSDPERRVARAAEVALARLEDRQEPPPVPPRASEVRARGDSVPPVDLGLVAVRLVTSAGSAVLELDGDRYPRTVANFLRLVDSGFYAHGTFHRVVPAFVVQGGCPRGDGWGDPGWLLPCEYGDLRYDDAGVVGMAHAGRDTGGSQFFITHVPVPRLDGRYTAFGRVREGMDVVDRIVRGDWFRIERVEPVAAR